MEKQNRRNFLKAGAILGTASIGIPTLGNHERPSTPIHKEGPTKIEMRKLGTGKESMSVSAVGLGCMGMSFHRSTIPDRKKMIAVIRKAHDMGVNFFDTAEAYGAYTNEELVGEALAPIRKDVFICTKFGFDLKDGKIVGMNSKPQQIRSVVEASLKRLKIDTIDLLYQHWPDPAVPLEDVAGTVKDLIKEGKAKRFGMCGVNGEQIRKAHSIQPLTAIQSEYSLLAREVEQEVLQTCGELGIGFVPYSPLGRGFLTGMINERTKFDANNDNRPSLPVFQPDGIKTNWAIIDLLAAFGNDRGLTVAQVALAFLLAQKPFIVPIPGTTKLAHLQENLWASDFKFTPEEFSRMKDDLAKITLIKN